MLIGKVGLHWPDSDSAQRPIIFQRFLHYRNEFLSYFCAPLTGEMAEWSIAVVLKTTVPQGTGGSNPSLTAHNSQKPQSNSFDWGFLLQQI